MRSCDEKFLVFEVAFCAGEPSNFSSEVGAMVMTTSLPCVGCIDDGLGDDGLELLGLNDAVYSMLLDLLGSNVVTRLKLIDGDNVGLLLVGSLVMGEFVERCVGLLIVGKDVGFMLG
jgi:hypothetical protein